MVRVSPSERLILVVAVATFGLFGALGVPLRSPAHIYLRILQGGLAWYGLGLLLCLLLVRLNAKGEPRSASFRRFTAHYLTRAHIIADCRAVNVSVLTFFFFLQLKHLVPILTQARYDGLLVMQEERLFGAALAAGAIQRLVPAAAPDFVSQLYQLFYPYLGFVLMVMVLQRDSLLRERFLVAFAMTWFGGLTVVYLFPTLGPCFVRSESIAAIAGTESRVLQEQLWRSYQFVVDHPYSAEGIASISGLPSLHVAVVALGSIALAELNRPLAALSWVLFVLTVYATIYLGWHYVMDDIAAIPLALAALALSRRLVR